MPEKLKEFSAIVFSAWIVVVSFTLGPCIVTYLVFSTTMALLEGRYIMATITGILTVVPSIAGTLWGFSVGIEFWNILRGKAP